MRKTIFVLATITILLAASAADAYVLLSPERRWASAVTVEVNDTGNSTITDGDGGVSNTAQAIGTWQNANGQVTSAGATRGDGTPTIELHDNGRICTGSCLAATLTGYYHQNSDGTYTIDDADVYTNQRYDYVSTSESGGCSGEFYIEGIMVHEVGHVLGIGHSNVAGSTMYPSVSYCDNGPASLHQDDKDAEADLYSGGGGPGPGCIDADGDGVCATEGDCNDNNNKIYPGANDTKGKQGRDGVDNDCDGVIDG